MIFRFKYQEFITLYSCMDIDQSDHGLQNKQSQDVFLIKAESLNSNYSQEDYTTNINELIAEPASPSPAEYLLSTLYELSRYLIRKKMQVSMLTEDVNTSFDNYLSSVEKQFNEYEGLHRRARISSKNMKLQQQQTAEELLQCYKKVPFAFFDRNFILDFGQLAKNIEEIKKRQQELNDHLDMVQINLFSQIHYKFQQYFKVVSNFEYLSHSLQVNIIKNREARQRMKKVKTDFIDKSKRLKQKITHRQNIQKMLKYLKIVKSLKKLPLIVKQILESSLPYECLSLLKSTKQSIDQVSELKCLDKVSQTVKQSQSLVQMGLNKRYADQLYLYIEESQLVNLQESWDRINSHGCMDISGLNGSMLGVSGILQESVLQMQPSTSKNKRNEGKQFQIAMILLQSYKFMGFPVDLIRIKISNSLRIFGKRFDNELIMCLKSVLSEKNEKLNQKILQNEQLKQKLQEDLQHNSLLKVGELPDDESALKEIVQKITVIFYVKHLYIYNEIMKDTIDKFLGYLYTLLIEYNQSKQKDVERFTALFKQELSILPSITKIVIDKLKFLMGLKNINGVSFLQFKQWIGLLQYWKKYTDNLVEQNPLVSLELDNEAIEDAINEAVKKMMTTLNINTTINELMLTYTTYFHENIINSQLEPSFAEESWQLVQIPSQFVEVLNNIVQWHEIHVNENVSVTILNDSKDLKANKSMSQDYSSAPKKTKFRVLKNNIMVDGVRYRVSVSFLLLCEFIDEYVKMMRVMPESRKFLYEKLLSLTEYYNARSRELILQAKARQFQKMKSKSINAKHMSLVHNCLSVLSKLIKEINYPQVQQLKEITVASIQSHKNELINKLSYVIKLKIQSAIQNFFTAKDSKVSQVNLNIVNSFVAMMSIIDQYLEKQDKKAVFKEAMDIFISRYFKELLMKGAEHSTDNRILVEKMRFLKPYFPEEFEVMEKQAKAR